MLSISVNRIKTAFIILIIGLVLILILGVVRLEGGYYWQKKYIAMQWLFIRTRVEYLLKSKPNILGLVGLSQQGEMKNIESHRFAQSIPVLLYHGVIEDPSWTPDDVNVRMNDFKRQMMALKAFGYETVSLDDFLSFLKGEKYLPEKSFLLTFDDGRKDSYYSADPILKALGYRAAMFVITGRSLDQDEADNTFHLNELELRKMAQSGRWDIESHGKNDHDLVRILADGNQGHFLSNKLWLKYEGRLETDEEYTERIEKDLMDSKVELEEKLKVKVRAFAYPFGDYGPGGSNLANAQNIILPIVQKKYPYSFYQVRSSDFIGNYAQNELLIKRFPVSSKITPNQLVTVFMNAQDKPINAFKDNFINDKGWEESWGKREFKDGLMLTGPTNAEDSSLTFLEGSYFWKDYTMESEVQLLKGKAFALLARYKNGNNYASCDFSEQEISVSERRGANEYTLAQAPYPSQIFRNPTKVGISVDGRKISCLVSGQLIVSSVLSSNLPQGGIGFKTWDNRVFNSELLVKRVTAYGTSVADGFSFRGILSKTGN